MWFNIFLLIIWLVTGLLVLIGQNSEISKFEYALPWTVLMMMLLRDIVCGV
jgi:hypothetical protein